MIRLVLWLRQRAGSLRTQTLFHRSGLTVRTVETVECQERTVFIVRLPGQAADICPLCGSTLGSNPDGRVRPQLRE